MRILMSMLIAVFLMGGQAVANDDPCENESGAAYGLCNAYCEAMDCDDPEMQEASDNACERVKANYLKITGNELTCETELTDEDACPCYSAEDVQIMVADSQNPLYGCYDDTHGNHYDVGVYFGDDYVYWLVTVNYDKNGDKLCEIHDQWNDPIAITQSQANACRNILINETEFWCPKQTMIDAVTK